MPADIGTLLVRISADISELKQGAQQAAAEIKKLKEQVTDSTSAINGWGASFSGLSGNMNSLVGGVGSFLGMALSVYGVLRLWQSAVEGFYSLMSNAVSQVDDYKRAIIGTAGMMTTITDRKYQPDLGAAYQTWKVYLQWLYDASLETDRKVAAGGQEIFEAARLMGIRGAVAKTKEQVYTVGLLVDFIKSITQGMPERQQLLQEVRSMFEGSMRPGAQALAQFEAIMPGFRQKFDEARKAAMAMGDASPIFALLREALKGSAYAAEDMQNTFESLYSSGVSGMQKLMLEAFTPAYEQMVKWGWEIMNVYYQQGRLTSQGQAIAAGLGTAWEQVKLRVQEWVDVLVNEPEKVVAVIARVCTFLGQAADLALLAAKALEAVVNAISSVTTGNIEALGVALGVAAGAAALLGANIKLAVAAAAAGYWVGNWLANVGSNEQTKAAQTAKATTYLGPDDTAKIQKEAIDKAGMWRPGEAAQDATIAAAQKQFTTTAQSFSNEISKQKFKNAQELVAYQVEMKNRIMSTEGLTTGQKSLRLQAFYKSIQDAGNLTPENAPDTPRVLMAGGKEPKGKKGSEGKTDEYAQLYKQLMDLESKIAQTTIDKKIAAVRAQFKTTAEEIQEQWKKGELSYEQYFTKLKANITSSYDYEKKLIEEKKVAANKTLQEQLVNNKQRAANKELSDESAKVLDLIEIRKRDLAVVKAEGDLAKLAIQNQKDLVALKEKELQLQESIFKYQQQSSWAAMSAKGPVSAKEASVQQMWDKFFNEMENRGIKKGDTGTIKSTGFDEFGNKVTNTAVGGDVYNQEYLKAKEREWQIKWGQATRDAADAISTGFSSMIESLMSGSGDFKQVANDMFKKLFEAAMKPGLEKLTEMLMNGFKQMFQSLGEGAGLAIMGVIGLVGMLLTSNKSKSSFSPAGIEKGVTSSEAVRGVIAGETSIPIAKISVSLSEALVATNGILSQIERNTRGGSGGPQSVSVQVSGMEGGMKKAIEDYLNNYLLEGV